MSVNFISGKVTLEFEDLAGAANFSDMFNKNCRSINNEILCDLLLKNISFTSIASKEDVLSGKHVLSFKNGVSIVS